LIYLFSAFLLVLTLFLAWRFSKAPPDADWAMFNLATFTGSIYGRDFVDCKSPGVHLLYWAIAKLVGENVERVRFTYHVLVGLPGIVYTLATRDIWGGLAFTILINSGWLWAFHGNVDQVPAGLILLAFVTPAPVSVFLWSVAVFYEPKLVLTFIAMIALRGWWIEAGVAAVMCGAIALYLYLKQRQWFDRLWEANFTIPKRMNEKRRGLYKWIPWFTGQTMVYVLPWIMAAVYSKPDPLYWLPVVVYLVFISLGRVIRQFHLFPIVPWIALAGIPAQWVFTLFVLDLLASGFYLGDIWFTFYSGLRAGNFAARAVGKWLKNQWGTVWINNMHTEILIYAEKPVLFGLTEQLEINQVADERRQVMLEKWPKAPPTWVVTMADPMPVQFVTTGYHLESETQDGLFKIWRRDKK
jgi:hypothetical protein